MCTSHLITCSTYMAEWMRLNVIDPDRERRRRDSIIRAGEQHRLDGSVVYYVRLGDHVKIGTTVNLTLRLRALYLDHDASLLLAVEPGGFELEQIRHEQFDAERVHANRELFNPSPRLLAHIDSLPRLAA